MALMLKASSLFFFLCGGITFKLFRKSNNTTLAATKSIAGCQENSHERKTGMLAWTHPGHVWVFQHSFSVFFYQVGRRGIPLAALSWDTKDCSLLLVDLPACISFPSKNGPLSFCWMVGVRGVIGITNPFSCFLHCLTTECVFRDPAFIHSAKQSLAKQAIHRKAWFERAKNLPRPGGIWGGQEGSLPLLSPPHPPKNSAAPQAQPRYWSQSTYKSTGLFHVLLFWVISCTRGFVFCFFNKRKTKGTIVFYLLICCILIYFCDSSEEARVGESQFLFIFVIFL